MQSVYIIFYLQKIRTILISHKKVAKNKTVRDFLQHSIKILSTQTNSTWQAVTKELETADPFEDLVADH